MLRRIRNFSLSLIVSFAAYGESSDVNQLARSIDKYRSLETFAQTMYYIETMYVDAEKAQPQNLITNALQGIVSQLDPHTVFLPKRAFEQLTMDTKGKFGGIGIIVSQEKNRLVIVSPIENTPAFRAGIKAGDEIIAIDSKPLMQMEGNEAVDVMRGHPGSKIKLTLKRKDIKEPLIFELIREIVKVKSVKTHHLGADIGYVRISSFQEDTADELHNFLKDSPQLKGLVMDLRDNPGGLLNQSVKVVDLFIDSGLIVSTVGRDPDKIEREFAYSKNTFKGFPIIVLVNDGSASASEIVAGALQDHRRALVMGVQSFGKGSVQTLISLPDGSGLKLTVARYYTPNDRSIQATGITPDIIVPSVEENTPSKRKKESDLKGHIKSMDMDHLPRVSSTSEMEHWPEPFKTDHQLMTAYAYLKGWSFFK